MDSTPDEQPTFDTEASSDEGILRDKIWRNKLEGYNWQRRRHPQWTENYELYRDTVIINRLTQRQTVNIPLMKETIRTVLAGIDEPRDTYFEEISNDKQKEIFLNEYWKFTYDLDKIELKDIVDKKQVCLYGRSFWKLNIKEGYFASEVLDPQDVLVDRYADPSNLFGIDHKGRDTSRTQYVIHQHIFRTLREVEANPLYDTEAVENLKVFFSTDQGLIRSSENTQSLAARNQRMIDMGVPDAQAPFLGETIIELNEHYIKLWDEEAQEFVIHLVTTAQDREILVNKPLKEVLGISFFPFVSWADDVERTDVWSDGTADVVRTPNKVLNAWFSQLVENRTLANFGMNYYNTAMDGFVPQTFDATPWGWYPIPAGDRNLADVIQHVEIDPLTNSLEEINFLIQMVERSTAATAIEKGTSEKNEITLGEVQLLAAKAQQRISDMAKFYRLAWKEFGDKWYQLIEANADTLEPVKLYKKSYKGNYFSKKVGPKDWKSDEGYTCKVISEAEREQDALNDIQKLNAIKTLYPSNVPLSQILEKKLLDIADLTPEEIKEVMDYEKQTTTPGTPTGQPGQPVPGTPGQAPQPGRAGAPPRIGPYAPLQPQQAQLPNPVTQLAALPQNA